jgi:pentatricopeptide repeat protein
MGIHEEIIRSGFQSDAFVESALIDMYAKCGRIEDACQLFDRMLHRDVVCWTAMIAAYAQNGNMEEALNVFQKMPEQNKVSWNAMVAGYLQNGHVDEALKFFLKMPESDVASWTTLIAGCTQNGHAEEALNLFRQMQLAGLKPSAKAFASVLSACGNLAALEYGSEIHEEIIRNGFLSDVFVANSLVDMYAKCGSIENARNIFDKMHQKNTISWTAIIAGYAMHGCSQEALILFEQMQHSGIYPDQVTFLCVLSACCHAGLVDEGLRYFLCMNHSYNIVPTMEHYGCMVDLLGRAGRLNEAQDFINKMPIKPDASVWGCLLSACRIHNNTELAEHAAEHLFELVPQNAAPYVVLSNIYAAAGKWDDIEKVRKMMKDRSIKKMPGCSWIEVNKRVHSFLVENRPDL